MQTGADIRSARQFDVIVVNLETKVPPRENLDLVNTGQFSSDYAAEIAEVNYLRLSESRARTAFPQAFARCRRG